MYNLLIVDDEAAVVNGLANSIDWSSLRIDEVFRACDAGKALECLEKNRVDICLLDIRMPGMDGLQLATLIRDRWPYARVIFMSGYDHFAFAKKAVELGAVNYILKPAADEEIKEAVEKAIAEIERDLKHTSALENAERQMKEAISTLQERYLNAWIVQERADPLKEPGRLGACGLRLNFAEPALLAVLRVDSWEKRVRAEHEEVARLALQNLTGEILLKNSEGIFFADPERNMVLLVQDPREKLYRIAKLLEGMAGFLQKTAGELLGCTVSIFWAEPAGSLWELPGLYKSILREMHRRMAWGYGIISNVSREAPSCDAIELESLNSHPSLVLLVDMLDKEGAVRKLEAIFQDASRMNPPSVETLLEIYYTVAGSLVAASKKRGTAVTEWAGPDTELFFSFGLIHSVSELKQWSLRILDKYMEYELGRENRQTHKIIEQIKKLILQKLWDNISIADIASAVYLNQSYLSRLFKRETGMSITDYMIRLKMEKAKELLNKPGMKVYEVAESLGYESVSHFNRLFKRETGMNPKEFQIMP